MDVMDGADAVLAKSEAPFVNSQHHAPAGGLKPSADAKAMSPTDDDSCCYICLGGTEEGALQRFCNCPTRFVHPQCMARWQLQQAGKAEETHCRFCASPLADWKGHLTPEALRAEVEKAQPVMVVFFEGKYHRIPVKKGPEGVAEFTAKVRTLFKLPDDVDMNLTFGCKEPMSGQSLKLEGIGAFDAAVHCASVAAAERQARVRRCASLPAAGGLAAALRGTGDATDASGPLAERPAPAGPTPTPPNMIRPMGRWAAGSPPAFTSPSPIAMGTLPRSLPSGGRAPAGRPPSGTRAGIAASPPAGVVRATNPAVRPPVPMPPRQGPHLWPAPAAASAPASSAVCGGATKPPSAADALRGTLPTLRLETSHVGDGALPSDGGASGSSSARSSLDFALELDDHAPRDPSPNGGHKPAGDGHHVPQDHYYCSYAAAAAAAAAKAAAAAGEKAAAAPAPASAAHPGAQAHGHHGHALPGPDGFIPVTGHRRCSGGGAHHGHTHGHGPAQPHAHGTAHGHGHSAAHAHGTHGHGSAASAHAHTHHGHCHGTHGHAANGHRGHSGQHVHQRPETAPPMLHAPPGKAETAARTMWSFISSPFKAAAAGKRHWR